MHAAPRRGGEALDAVLVDGTPGGVEDARSMDGLGRPFRAVRSGPGSADGASGSARRADRASSARPAVLALLPGASPAGDPGVPRCRTIVEDDRDGTPELSLEPALAKAGASARASPTAGSRRQRPVGVARARPVVLASPERSRHPFGPPAGVAPTGSLAGGDRPARR
jgi:hypothetical protein